MAKIQVKYTALQLGEICHKLNIVEGEPDLQESYEITQDEASAIYETFRAAKPGEPVSFDSKFCELIVGELEDVQSMWAHNAADNRDTSELSMASACAAAIRKTKNAMRQAA